MRKSKLLKVLLTLSFLLIIIGVPISSYGADKEKGLYISSETIPSKIEERAKDMFLSTNHKDIEYLGIDTPLENLTLSKGIKSKSIDGIGMDKYYFFVLDGDKIVAEIALSEVDGQVFSTYSSGSFDSLNYVKNTVDNPFRILFSDNSLYYLDNNNIYTISNSLSSNENTILNDKNTISKNRSLYYNDKNNEVISISEDNVYDIKLNNTMNNSRTIYGLSLDNFPYVPNDIFDGVGICWASATGAIIEYILNGYYSDTYRGTELRDELVQRQIQDMGHPNAGITDARYYIKNYTGRVTGATETMLSWEDCKYQIASKKNPCYLSYVNLSTNSGHAVVLCGYDYDNGDGLSKAYNYDRRIYLMDPNKEDWQKIDYGSYYTPIYGSTYYCRTSSYAI